jgi:hypothetical protein
MDPRKLWKRGSAASWTTKYHSYIESASHLTSKSEIIVYSGIVISTCFRETNVFFSVVRPSGGLHSYKKPYRHTG